MNTPRLLLCGYGQLGQNVARLSVDSGLTLVGVCSQHAKEASLGGTPFHPALTVELLRDIDVVVDCSIGKQFLANFSVYLQAAASAKPPAIVVGGTGWYDELAEVQKKVEEAGNLRLIWAPNFSLGVYIYIKLLERAGELLGPLEQFDVWGYELHHSRKADSPSGTAKVAIETILRTVPRKTKVVTDRLDRRIEADEFHFASVRGGLVNFEHTVGFDSPTEGITIRHAVRDRSVYAAGALAAARWIIEQRPGIYTMDLFMESLLGRL